MTNRGTLTLDVPRDTVIDLLKEIESPFTKDIRMGVIPDRLKLLDMKYDGIGDPANHLEIY